MIDKLFNYWNLLSQNNKVALIVAILAAVFSVFGYFWRSWFGSTPHPHIDSQPTVTQTTSGENSPAIAVKKGNVEINYFDASPKVVKRLEELLDKKDVDLINAQEEVDHWLNKYNELKVQLSQRPATDKLAAKAKILLDDGDLEGAEELLKTSLAHNLVRIAQLAKKAAKDAYNLGSIKELQLDYVSARSYYEQAAAIAPENTRYLNQAGIINQELADFEKAINYFKLALTIDLQKHGEDHRYVASYRNNIGHALASLGKYKKAIEYYELALASSLKIDSKNHSQVAKYRNNIGGAWKVLGEPKKAIEYYELALASDIKNYGKEHHRVAILHSNLGLAWNELGDHEKALKYHNLALDQ